MTTTGAIAALRSACLSLAAMGVLLGAHAATPMVAADVHSALILRSDGTVWATGMQFFPNGTGPFTSPGLVPTVSNVAAVESGGGRQFVVFGDGSLFAWGTAMNGGLGTGANSSSTNQPQRVVGLPPIVKLSCEGHCVALDASGAVWAWGRNDEGQVGNGATVDQPVPIRIGGLPAIATVAAGEYYSLAADTQGRVWAWGANYGGQVAYPGSPRHTTPHLRTDLAGIVALAGGGNHAMALRSDGVVFTWGTNTHGQRGSIDPGLATPAEAVQGLAQVVAIAAASEHSFALRSDGTLWGWGLNTHGVVGSGDASQSVYFQPTRVAGLANIVQVATSLGSSFAIDSAGAVYGWGDNSNGVLGDNTLTSRPTPQRVAGPGGPGAFNVFGTSFASNALPIAAGRVTPERGTAPLTVQLDATASFDRDGSIVAYEWLVSNGQRASGRAAQLILADAGTYDIALLVTDNAGGSGFVGWRVLVDPAPRTVQATPQIAASCSTVTGLRSDGRIFEWGFGISDPPPGSSCCSSTPRMSERLFGIVKIAAGSGHSLAIGSDGRVSAWGSNTAGQIGDGTNNPAFSPLQVPGLSSVTDVAAGDLHSLAATSDGGAWAWGSNGLGQLGTGNSIDSRVPVRIPSLSGVRSVAAHGNSSFAVLQDGTVWGWGSNSDNNVGDGTRMNRPVPVRVGTLSGIERVWCGPAICLARAADGSVWGWGDSALSASLRPQLPPLLPFRIPALARFVSFAFGFGSAVAIDASGGAWVWGANGFGQLGDGTRQSWPAPVRLPGVDHGVQAAYNACANGGTILRSDGTLLAWGENQVGTVGDGTFARRATPVSVLNPDASAPMDLAPDVPNVAPPDPPSIYSHATTAGGLSDPLVTVDTLFRFNAEDIGRSANVYVFALAPAGIVQGASGAKETKDTPVQCVLAQLNASGQLQAVSVANLQAYVSAVASGQAQAVSILNGVPAVVIGGATFYVGYGPSSGGMLSNGTNRSVAGIPGAARCEPEAPQSGWWYNPAEGGRGFSIEARGNRLFMAAFHYEPDGRATWNFAGGRTSLDGSLFMADFLTANGGQTLTGPYRLPGLANAGTITFAFSDAAHGTMVWPGGTVAIERQPFVPDGLTIPPQSGLPEAGWWWNPAESGRGFFIEWQAGYVDIAGYMYDEQGRPTWYISALPTPDPMRITGNWWTFAGGQAMGQPYRPATRTSDNAGALDIQFSSSTMATLTLPDGRRVPLVRQAF